MRKLLAAALLAALAASPLLTVPAQAQTPIKIMVGGIDKQVYLPAKLAAQLGFFKEQGLDVELFNSTSGSQAFNLRDGSIRPELHEILSVLDVERIPRFHDKKAALAARW